MAKYENTTLNNAAQDNAVQETAPPSAFFQTFSEYIRAGYQILFVHTTEEARAEHEINKFCRDHDRGMVTWDVAVGFSVPALKDEAKYRNIAIALDAITDEKVFPVNKDTTNIVFVFRDCDDFMAEPAVRRRLKSMTEGNMLVRDRHKRPLIIISSSLNIHPKLRASITVLEFDLPDDEQIGRQVEHIRLGISGRNKNANTLAPDLRQQIVANLRGLSQAELDNCLSRCIVRHAGFQPEMLATIKAEKAKIVRSSGVLTYIPEDSLRRREEIGGYDLYMSWLDQRKLAYTPEAQALKIDPPRGAILLGLPGCIADDTMVAYRRGERSGSRRLSIGDFHDKFNGVYDYTNRTGAAWQEGLDTYLQSFDAATGKVFYNRVKGVYYKGDKACLRIDTDTAGGITLTYDHPILNSEGVFRPASEFQVGDRITVRGSMAPRTADSPPVVRRERIVVEGLKYYPQGWAKETTDPVSGKTYQYKRTHKARLVLEARMNGLPYDEFVRILCEEQALAETLTYLEPSQEVHHLDEDPTNDAIENLAVMTKAEHTRLHCDETRFNVEYTAQATIVRIEDAGTRQTYDVSMEQPHCNFVTNDGVIVHNTGKSMVAKATCMILGLPGYILDIGSLFGSLVGESEQRTRDALKQVDAQQGCVLVIDEADKVLGNINNSSGDSGVSRRVFGTILNWLAENRSRTFCLMTLNRTAGLPPELMRAGRFDAMFYTELPNATERKQILDIHLRMRGVEPATMDVTADDWAAIIEKTNGFVGSELEEVVKDARYRAFETHRTGTPTADHLLLAAAAVIPMTATDPEGMKEIRQFCVGKAKPVTTATVVRTARRTTPPQRAIDVSE